MKWNLEERTPLSGGQLALWFALAVIAVVAISSVMGAVLVPWLEQQQGALAEFCLSRGPVKFVRRIMTILALPFLIWLARKLGWGGWRDVGWSTRPSTTLDPFWRRDLFRGLGVGVITFAVMVGSAWVAGTRFASSSWDGAELFLGPLEVLFTGLVVAVIEETIARGVLLRLLARPWSWFLAAVFTSMMFAYAHFMEPSAAAFEAEGVWNRALRITVATFSDGLAADDVGLRFLNMTLMSCVLCLMFIRTRTIWMAVGTHAAWASMRLFNADLADRAREVPASLWFSGRADQTDGLATTFMLLVLLALVWRFVPVSRTTSPLTIHG